MSNSKPKYSAITLGIVLAAAFVVVQPALTANAIDIMGEPAVPAYDDCDWVSEREPGDTQAPGDPITMTSVRSGHVVKTVHAEKEIFNCFLTQGNLPVIADLTTYTEIYENITSKVVLKATAFATVCLKDGEFDHDHGNQFTATVIDCMSYDIPTTPTPVGANCHTHTIDHPQEQNMVLKGKIAKTIESQKEVWGCILDDGTRKKVDIVMFTDVYENLGNLQRTDVQFHVMRCVVLISDTESTSTEGDLQDASVESCKFSTLVN